MSESLRKLVNLGSFNILQDKLEEWLDNYHYNTCDQNVAKGCEIVELNSHIQGQLFKLLNVCASEGGVYGGAGVLKTRLLPLLEKGFFSSGLGSDSSKLAISDLTSGKIKSSREVKRIYEKSLDDLEHKFNKTKRENDSLKLELESMRFENDQLKVKADASETYQREIDHLKDDVAVLRSCRSPSPCLDCRHGDCSHHHHHRHHGDSTSHHHHRSLYHNSSHHHAHHHGHSCHGDLCCCPLECSLHNCTLREQQVVSKFNDLFSISRIDAMHTLARFSDNHDNNQKIIFHTVVEAFNAAKIAFRTYKNRVRTDMIGCHTGSLSLEEKVQHHIDNHGEHEGDFSCLSKDVLRALQFKVPIIQRPPGVGFDLINSFITAACKVAWNMACLPDPIDVYHPTTEGELYDEKRYRRSYDSEYSAPFVFHHIWPCLVKNGAVISKGEAVTLRNDSYAKNQRLSRSPERFSSNLNSGRLSPILKKSSSVGNFRSSSPIIRRSKRF